MTWHYMPASQTQPAYIVHRNIISTEYCPIFAAISIIIISIVIKAHTHTRAHTYLRCIYVLWECLPFGRTNVSWARGETLCGHGKIQITILDFQFRIDWFYFEFYGLSLMPVAVACLESWSSELDMLSKWCSIKHDDFPFPFTLSLSLTLFLCFYLSSEE